MNPSWNEIDKHTYINCQLTLDGCEYKCLFRHKVIEPAITQILTTLINTVGFTDVEKQEFVVLKNYFEKNGINPSKPKQRERRKSPDLYVESLTKVINLTKEYNDILHPNEEILTTLIINLPGTT